MTALDDLDRRLVAALRHAGRAPVAKRAAIRGGARGTVQTRLDRLVQTGTILGFTARVKQGADNAAVRAVMTIEVTGKSTEAIIKRLRGLPELHALHTTNGAWDLVAEIRAASLPEFDRVLRDVRAIDGILNSETSILLSSV